MSLEVSILKDPVKVMLFCNSFGPSIKEAIMKLLGHKESFTRVQPVYQPSNSRWQILVQKAPEFNAMQTVEPTSLDRVSYEEISYRGYNTRMTESQPKHDHDRMMEQVLTNSYNIPGEDDFLRAFNQEPFTEPKWERIQRQAQEISEPITTQQIKDTGINDAVEKTSKIKTNKNYNHLSHETFTKRIYFELYNESMNTKDLANLIHYIVSNSVIRSFEERCNLFAKLYHYPYSVLFHHKETVIITVRTHHHYDRPRDDKEFHNVITGFRKTRPELTEDYVDIVACMKHFGKYSVEMKNLVERIKDEGLFNDLIDPRIELE